MKIPTNERIQGGLWGLLVGDALGVPYEFRTAEEIPPIDKIDFEPPTDFSRTYPSVPPGTWSDDGAQALCLLHSLLTNNKLEPDHLMQQILDWYENGTWAVDRKVFDIGVQTRSALQAYQQGTPALQAGSTTNSKGNGSLMRVLPLALWHKGSDEALVHDAHQQSMITHGHHTNQACCALYCLWARNLLTGISVEEAYRAAVDRLRDIYDQQFPEYLLELDTNIKPDQPPQSTGREYVVDSFHAARIALQQPTYELVVKHAIRLGDDTDTNAAIAGGLAGIRDGVNAIPIKWLLKLRGKEMVQPLLEKLLQYRA